MPQSSECLADEEVFSSPVGPHVVAGSRGSSAAGWSSTKSAASGTGAGAGRFFLKDSPPGSFFEIFDSSPVGCDRRCFVESLPSGVASPVAKSVSIN